MKWAKGIALILVVGIVVAALNDALGITGFYGFLVGIPFGIAAMLYAIRRWNMV